MIQWKRFRRFPRALLWASRLTVDDQPRVQRMIVRTVSQAENKSTQENERVGADNYFQYVYVSIHIYDIHFELRKGVACWEPDLAVFC